MKTKIMICTIALLLSAFTGNVYAGSEGTYNTFYGQGAGAGTTGDDDYDTFIGAGAGLSNTTGWANTFVGCDAGILNTTGWHNTFLGWHAGYENTIGNYNTFLGTAAGYQNTTGNGNTFVGRVAGPNNTTGIFNTFIGESAGQFNTTGFGNTFVGVNAGAENSTGNYNTVLGTYAGPGPYTSTASGNVFLGFSAGHDETGSNKLYIDNSYFCSYPPYTCTPLIYGEFDSRFLSINGNLEVIGPYQGLVYLSDNTTDSTTKVSRMVLNHYSNTELPVYLFGAASTETNNFVAFGGGNTIGNAATQIDLFTAPNNTTPVGYPRLTIIGNGYVGIGTQSPSYPLALASGAYVTTGGVWTNASSREYKDNIEALATEEAFDTLKELNPVKFAYKKDMTEKHVGFISEEVPELIATKDRKGLSPMDIVAVLTKVVQEQQKIVKELKAENEGLKAKNESLENRLLVIEATIKAPK